MSKRFLLMTVICIFVASCSGRTTVLFTQNRPEGGALTVNWSFGNLLTFQGLGRTFKGEVWPLFIGDISTDKINALTYSGNSLSPPVLDPKISPDGGYIAFQPIGGADVVQLGLFKNSRISKLENIDMPGESLAWSPDSKKLAILNMAKLANQQLGAVLSIYNLSEKRSKKILEVPDKNLHRVNSISWSHDGNKIAFSLEYYADNYPRQRDVFIYNLVEERLIRVTSTQNSEEAYVSWHPNDDILVFTFTPPGGGELADTELVFSTSNGACTKTFSGLKGVISPSWSPNGEQMVFISTNGVELIDVAKVIPAAFLSPQKLCQ